MEEPDATAPTDPRGEARRRFAKLPERVEVEDMVESEPMPPRPEPAYDENVEAIRWFGIPL
jgi:hypothetical protein